MVCTMSTRTTYTKRFKRGGEEAGRKVFSCPLGVCCSSVVEGWEGSHKILQGKCYLQNAHIHAHSSPLLALLPSPYLPKSHPPPPQEKVCKRGFTIYRLRYM